ncbi:MAG: tetratricopeptide repeat protein [Bacteroidia bacterium]
MYKLKIIFLFFAASFFLVVTGCSSKKNATVANTSSSNNKNSLSQKQIDDAFKLHSLFYDACKEKIKGNADVAMNLFKECLKIDTKNAPANFEIANIYRYTGNYENALSCAKNAALADEKNEWYNILYIECLHNKHLYLDAAMRYEILVKKYPYRADFYQGLAGEYIYAGKPDKAIQAYDRAQKTIGADDDISLQKVKLFTQLKKWNDAEIELKKMIANNPKETIYYTYLADLYQQQNQPEKALDVYKNALKNDSLNPSIHLNLAEYYRQQNKYDNFYSELKKAFVSDDLDIDNKVRILRSYFDITMPSEKQQTTEAAKKLTVQAYELNASLVAQYPTNGKAHSMYADFLFRDKKYAEAADQLKKVLQYDKSKYAVWNQLLVCDAEMRAYDSLVKHSEEAIDLFPEQPAPYYLNGIAYKQLKQYQKAVQPLKEGKQFVFEDVPLAVEFSSNLGDVYNTLKEYQKSDKEFDQVVQLDPDNAGVLNNYAYYLSLRKENLEKAEIMSKHSLEIVPNSINYMDTYGWILYQQTKYDEAKRYLEKAFDRGGYNRPAIVEHYGDVLYKLNETDKAVENWKKAKELGGNSDILNKKIADKKLYE